MREEFKGTAAEAKRLRRSTAKFPVRGLFGELRTARTGADDVLAFLFNTFPEWSPALLEFALKSQHHDGEVVRLSYEMLNIGAANEFKAICSEIGVDLKDHVRAVDGMLGVAEQCRKAKTFHCGTIVLRYVAESPGFLSMQPRETCMIELPMLRDVFGADEMLWRYENLLVPLVGGRPHWGQRNFLTRDVIERLYPHLRDWEEVFSLFNKEGRFSNRFTDRVGLS